MRVAGWVGAASSAAVVWMVLGPGAGAAQGPGTRPKFDRFEVATVKPVDPGLKAPRFITMQGADRFVVKDYTLKGLIAAAYDLNPKTISGGPGWVETQHYDIVAKVPGTVRPSHVEQMAMLRGLLADRFELRFHREKKEFSIYALEVEKGGAKLKASAEATDAPAMVGPGMVYPQKVVLPARNATMEDFCELLQRAVLDRPVVDRTGLPGRYDFDLTWAPDSSQFGGEVGSAEADAASAPLFTAVREQLGLRLEATKGPVEALVVDGVERPGAD